MQIQSVTFKPQEYRYLDYFSKWEETAPRDGHRGTLDGRFVRNTQTARMGTLLALVVAGNTADSIELAFQKLARHTWRKDGNSYVSKDTSWMREPYEIARGWYFEGCMSLVDKQAIIKELPRLGLISAAFVPCAQDFVAAKSVQKYRPGPDEARHLIQPGDVAPPLVAVHWGPA